MIINGVICILIKFGKWYICNLKMKWSLNYYIREKEKKKKLVNGESISYLGQPQTDWICYHRNIHVWSKCVYKFLLSTQTQTLDFSLLCFCRSILEFPSYNQISSNSIILSIGKFFNSKLILYAFFILLKLSLITCSIIGCKYN